MLCIAHIFSFYVLKEQYFRNLSNWVVARPGIRSISGHLAVAASCDCARIEGVYTPLYSCVVA